MHDFTNFPSANFTTSEHNNVDLCRDKNFRNKILKTLA